MEYYQLMESASQQRFLYKQSHEPVDPQLGGLVADTDLVFVH